MVFAVDSPSDIHAFFYRGLPFLKEVGIETSNKDNDGVYLINPLSGVLEGSPEEEYLQGKFLWIDITEDVLSMSFSDRRFHKLDAQSLIKLYAKADLITVGSPNLVEVLKKNINENVVYLPSMFNKAYFLNFKESEDIKFSNIDSILTVGNEEYNRALYHQKNDLLYGSKKYLAFFGVEPYFINDHFDYIPFVAGMDEYFDILDQEASKLMFIPHLETMKWYHTRDNSALIDAYFSGKVPIAPEIPAYKDVPGVLYYKDSSSLKHITKNYKKLDLEDNFELFKNFVLENWILSPEVKGLLNFNKKDEDNEKEKQP